LQRLLLQLRDLPFSGWSHIEQQPSAAGHDVGRVGRQLAAGQDLSLVLCAAVTEGEADPGNPDGVVNDPWGDTHWDFRTSE